MSSKITSKNLSYDASLPPFLQRLHTQNASAAAASDGRHERPLARPRRARNADDDEAEAEDAPTYVDAATNDVLSAAEYAALADRPEPSAADDDDGGAAPRADGDDGRSNSSSNNATAAKKQRDAERTAAIGAPRKRKAGKVVGGGDGGADEWKLVGEKGGGSTENSGKKKYKQQPVATVKRGEDREIPLGKKEEDSTDRKMSASASASASTTKPRPRTNKGKKIKLSFDDD